MQGGPVESKRKSRIGKGGGLSPLKIKKDGAGVDSAEDMESPSGRQGA